MSLAVCTCAFKLEFIVLADGFDVGCEREKPGKLHVFLA